MSAPKGNRNAAKGKKWEEALRRALARSEGDVDLGLNPIADKVVSAARSGDMDAIHEIACRLDGKPSEHVYIEQDLTVSVGESDSLTPRLERLHKLRQGNTVQ